MNITKSSGFVYLLKHQNEQLEKHMHKLSMRPEKMVNNLLKLQVEADKSIFLHLLIKNIRIL